MPDTSGRRRPGRQGADRACVASGDDDVERFAGVGVERPDLAELRVTGDQRRAERAVDVVLRPRQHDVGSELTGGLRRVRQLTGGVLVEQLLTLARSEPGAPAVPMRSLDLAETVRQSLSGVVALAAARDVDIEMLAQASPRAVGDAGEIGVMVRNLVDNAIRYSPRGARIELRVDVREGAPLLQVDDSGPGIPQAERERVFDRFYRGATGDEPGTGLGLAIVRGIATRHGASVILGDSPLGGLRVTVRFPAP